MSSRARKHHTHGYTHWTEQPHALAFDQWESLRGQLPAQREHRERVYLRQHHGLRHAYRPDGLTWISTESSNFYVANSGNGMLSKFIWQYDAAGTHGSERSQCSGSTRSGDLYVANDGNSTVSEFSPGSTTPAAT